MLKKRLTSEQAAKIKGEGISFKSGIFLTEVRIFELTRENGDVLYYPEDLSEGTGWQSDIRYGKVIYNEWLMLVRNDNAVKCYYIPDMSIHHDEWLHNVKSEETSGRSIIMHHKYTTSLTAPKPAIQQSVD